jgi:hypothetical protein
MVRTAYDTARNASGQEVVRRLKNKEVRFPTAEEFGRYVRLLFEKQKGVCALTGLPLQHHDDFEDSALRCSLDRIDSNGHYEVNNLQVVCQFANLWKNATENEDFVRLIDLVRKSPVS